MFCGSVRLSNYRNIDDYSVAWTIDALPTSRSKFLVYIEFSSGSYHTITKSSNFNLKMVHYRAHLEYATRYFTYVTPELSRSLEVI